MSVPTNAAGFGKVIVAFDDGVIPAARSARCGTTASSARSVVRAPPAVVAVEPQRQLMPHLYASKEQINAIGSDRRATNTTRVGGKQVKATRPGVTGEGVTLAVLDSGILGIPVVLTLTVS